MKSIEISDITKAINKKDTLDGNLFLINNQGNDNDNDNQFLIQPISTTVYSDKEKNEKEKGEKNNNIEEIDTFTVQKIKKNNNVDKEDIHEQEIINTISEFNTENDIKNNSVTINLNNTNNKNIHNSLGQSIILLLNSNKKALISSIDLYKQSTFIKSSLTMALLNIENYIRNDKTGNAIKIIYNPLKEMIIKKKYNSFNSFKIINWLYFNPKTEKQLKHLLIKELNNDNKKSKYIAVQIYKNIIEEQSQLIKNKEEILIDNVQFWKELIEIYSPLINIIQNNSVIDKDGNTQPTLLTTLTNQIIISIFTSNTNIILNNNIIKTKNTSSRIIEEKNEISLNDFYPIYWKSVECLSCALGYLISCDKKKYPLFDYTINEILDFIENIILKKNEDVSKENDIMKVIAKLWININPYLSAKYIKRPIEKTKKNVEKLLDEENEDFGHFGLLLKLSLILGHQDQKNFIEIFKSDKIKKEFLTIVSSNILNNEFIAGRNLGFYILRKFLLIDGPEKFKPMVDQLLIMLDQDDSVSKACIGFLAEYAT
ncbi:hypothetical protein BCR32DRAFT_246455 [Anaeromyces robustus]|uniref:Uncharacterized protein n=1 Tax=Anaeromyces robustus TaxID=1754192 RepID=A0A1Y1X0N2_9FUNG|nr:hypothetical protein BCR32DRAFT_246455 [Anaeromyces robustus]|eukprot:ORX79369.1 hypothetical protein BCR32DRAFT_246455 [Anaeromyces robustus]